MESRSAHATASPVPPALPEPSAERGADAPAVAAPTTAQTASVVDRARAPRRELGGTGLKVSPIALSGKRFGGNVPDSTADDILDAYVALGGNFIDTADSYGDGRSEQLVGEWMRRRGNRDRMVVSTKIGKSLAHPGLSARAIAASVNASLARLGTEHIDLLYLHIDDTEVPFEETLLAVDDLIRRGKVRAFGMSDHTGTRLLAARVACALMGIAPMAALQNEYSLVHREGYEGDLARIAAQQELAVMARFPLAGGFLAGSYRSRGDLAHTPAASYIAPHLSRRGRRVLGAVAHVAEQHDAAMPTVALAWLLSRPGVVAPVVSVRKPEQLVNVLAASELYLTRHELAELDRASA